MSKRLTVGAIVGHAASDYMQGVMKGIEKAAERYEVNVIYYTGVHMSPSFYDQFDDKFTYDYDYQYNVMYDYAALSGCDVLLITYGTISMFMQNADKQQFLDKFASVPFVVILDRDEKGRGSSIISDNYRGMYKVVEHLVGQHGYRTLAFLEGPAGNADAKERKRAFVDVCKEYSIPVEDRMFQRGDFTARVQPQIRRLMDDNPGLEALVCCNDIMADEAYRECEARGLEIGKDIAIVGYDDWIMAAKMNPPLTTVDQGAFSIGFTALEEAISLYGGDEPTNKVMLAPVRIRNSCGCVAERIDNRFDMGDEQERYVSKVLSYLLKHSLISGANQYVEETVKESFRPVVTYLVEEFVKSGEYSIDNTILNKLFNDITTDISYQYISPAGVGDAVESIISNLISREKDVNRIRGYVNLLSSIQSHIRSILVKSESDNVSRAHGDATFLPYMSLQMMNNIEDREAFYLQSVELLTYMGCKSAYLFLLEGPVKHRRGDTWILPSFLQLIAASENGQSKSYKQHEAPIHSRYKLLTEFFKRDDRYIMNVYDVFLAENQYGILVTETESEHVALLNMAALQISSAINARVLYVEQQKLHAELGESLRELEEKTKILSFLSEYDELTGCYNRRGYAEKARQLLADCSGEFATILIADLDHLKEINDTFGHIEGDYAIGACAKILREALGQSSILARIGGDEFVAIVHEAGLSAEEVAARVKQVNEVFTSTDQKPYYVEMSLGYYEFCCSPKLDLQELTDLADRRLYASKAMRRKSIVRAAD